MGNIGNTFKKSSITGPKPAKKVWREIHDQYPAGGTLTIDAAWISKGVIPAGSPVKFDQENKTIKAYTDTEVKAASDVSALGINGYLQEDVYLEGATSANDVVATGTVVYRGELYGYMFDKDAVAALEGVVPGVVFVW